MQPRLTLGTKDFARALAFYRAGLGLPIETLMDDVVFFRLNSVCLGLYGRAALAENANPRDPLPDRAVQPPASAPPPRSVRCEFPPEAL